MDENKNQDFDKGQHFLINKKVLMKFIEAANLSKKESIIEIGAGNGNITKCLASEAGNVTAYEIDKKFNEELKQLSKEHKNLEIIADDALKYKWYGFDKIVSNIPFYLSEAIINKAIKSDIKELILIVGRAFKDKLFRKEKSGLIARKFYTIEPVFFIEGSSFEPKLLDNPWVIRFVKKKNISKLDQIILQIALSKGKIKNGILKALISNGITKRQARSITYELNLPSQILEKPAVKITSKLFILLEKKLAEIKI